MKNGAPIRRLTLDLDIFDMQEIVKALGERKAEHSAALYLRMNEIFKDWHKLPEVKESKNPKCKCTAIMFTDDEIGEKEIDSFAEKVAEIFSQKTAEIPEASDQSHAK